MYGECSTECKKYNEWYNSKRHWHAAKLPVPLENHCSEVFSQPSSSFDVEKAALNLHKKIKKKLTVSEWAIYERLYVKNLTEDETAQQLGFETNEKGRKRGYKRIKQVKIIIIKKAKEIINEYGAEGIVHE
ncbi:MAG: hypothetical protein HC836_12655 [Richelia sp. RM2_1_2]|nr:hypothetical protein [Richelia sp. RM2_1_2]